MHRIKTYLPQDRLRALANNIQLPQRANGSAIFADISGFTALGENLTHTLGPRKGVDVLSVRLNTVYNSLIEQVDRYGGSIISFAGDSIVGWFEEAGVMSAPLRAVTCAYNMQEVMKGFEDLALKITVSTGPAKRFVVGNPAIQIIDTLAGKTVSRLSTAERLAQRGDVVLDQPTHEAVAGHMVISEKRVSAEVAEEFFVLGSITDPSDPQPLPSLNEELLSNESLRPWLLSAVYEREIGDIGSFFTELRPATPVFVNFSGIDYDGDEQAGKKLDDFVDHVQDIVSRYEGSLLQLTIGDKGSYIYAVFGAPVAHEDDTRRAVNAALEMQQIPSKLKFIQKVQIGISLGTLRVGTLGGNMRQTFAALGDDVNLAARLMSLAGQDEILITGKAQSEVADIFTMEPREPIRMKGVGEPQSVFSVTGTTFHRATRLPEPSYRLPMIGRQEELALIDSKLRLALQGNGQVIGITAEAGMGKSRLVAEAIRLARKHGFVGYGGACHSSGTNTPYLVWKPIWQAFFDLDPEMAPRKQIRLLEGEIEDRVPDRIDALPLLGLLLDLSLPENDFTQALDPKDRRSTLEILLEECLQSAAKETPLLIVLEDLHWIDPLSQELLNTLSRVSGELPICFVLAYRPADQVRYKTPQVEELPYFTKIELKDLSASDAEQLIRSKLLQLFPERTGSLPKALVDELTIKSEGNPFFIEELLNFLHDRGLNPYDERALKSLELPNSLQTLILSRIDQLSESQKITLKAASVIGRVFPFSWLLGYYPSLGDETAVKQSLAVLSQLDLTPLDTPDPELAYLFKHIVTQEVAYETLSYATRAQLHELLARYLELIYPDNPPLDALAFHYSRSDNQPKKREYLSRSAEAAYAAFANETALNYYEQALALSPEQDELIDLHLKMGEILQTIGKRSEARSYYESAIQIAEEQRLLEQVVQCQIKLAAMFENMDQSIDLMKNAVDLARKINDPKSICDSLRELSNYQWRIGEFDSAFQNAGQSVDLARQLNDRKREAFGLFFMASIHSERGRYLESHKYFESSLAISRELNDVRRVGSTLLNWGTTYYYEGNYDISEKYVAESLASYHVIGDKRTISIGLNNLGNIFYLKQDYQTAEKYYRDALAIGRELNDRYITSIALTSLGITAFQQGKHEIAESCYEEGMALVRALNYKSTITLLHCYQGMLALVRGQNSLARESFHAGLTLAYESDIKAYVIYNLIGFACLHLAGDKLQITARLLSVSSTAADAIGFKIEPEVKQPYDRALSVVREKMTGDEFSSAWEDGQKMTMEQAVALALDDVSSQ